MSRIIHVALIVSVAVLCASCKSSDQTMEDGTQQKMMKPADVGPGVPPGHCRLVATVVKIEEAIGSGNEPCAKVPCVAEVRVDEILGYGSAFGTPLAAGKNIRIKFTYTTGPTQELFPAMLPPLPGLKVGTKFQADISAAGPSIGGSGGTRFHVDQYTIK